MHSVGVTDPQLVLIQETDPRLRSTAHLVLGRRAMRRNDLGLATEHFREAASLDPDSPLPKRALHSLGETVNPAPVVTRGLRRWLRVG